MASSIVSLLPSATEIVCALGLRDRLAGVSHSCDYPADVAELPRLSRPRRSFDGLTGAEIDAAVSGLMRDHGSVYEVDVPRLAALAPALVLTQGICDVCAVPEGQVTAVLAELPSRPTVLTLDAHDIAAILDGIRAVGRATRTEQRADACIAAIERRIAVVRDRVAGRLRPRVLVLEWLDPPYAPGHWVPELVTIAGGELLAGTARRPSYRVAWSDLDAADPDVLLIMPCGFGLAETVREAERCRDALERVAGRGIAAGRAYALEASALFSRSGPRFVDGLEVIAALLHPDVFPDAAVADRAAIFRGR